MLHFHLLQLNMWILPLKTFATAVFSITRGFLTQPGNRRQKFLATGPHSPDKNWRFPGPTNYHMSFLWEEPKRLNNAIYKVKQQELR